MSEPLPDGERPAMESAEWFTSADDWTGDDHDVRVLYNALSFAADAVDGVEEARMVAAGLDLQGWSVDHKDLRSAAEWLLATVLDWKRWSEDPEPGLPPSHGTASFYLDQLLEKVGLIEPAVRVPVCRVCQVLPSGTEPACTCPDGPTYSGEQHGGSDG